MSENERSAVLRSILLGEIPAGEARARLNRFPWDSEVELQWLTRQDVVRMLDRYVSRMATAKDIEEWADVIEGRDDIGLERGARQLLKEAIFELANPDITNPLDSQRARAWQERLRRD